MAKIEKDKEYTGKDGKKLKVIAVDKYNVCFQKEGKSARFHLSIAQFEEQLKK